MTSSAEDVAAPPYRANANTKAALWLAAAACLLYGSTWRYGFVGDDAFVLANNQWTKAGLSALPQVVSHSLYFGAVPLNGGLYRPVAGAYYVLLGALGGVTHPSIDHVLQVLLYGANAAVVFWFFSTLTPSTSIRTGPPAFALSVLATSLFIVHPIHTEVVCNIKSADEMLCLLFLLTSTTAWLLYADGASRWCYGASILTYALAVGSKETAVPMVVVFPALWYFFRQRRAWTSVVAALPFAAVALAFLGVRYVVLNGEPSTPIVTLLNNALLATDNRAVQVASALAFLGRYARMLVWPWPLSVDYSYNAIPLKTFADPEVWIAILICLGLGAVAFLGFRKRRVASFAVLWFAASIALVSNVFFLISTNFGERLLYLPSVMACYLAADLALRAVKHADAGTLAPLRSPLIAAPALLIVAIAGLAVTLRAQDWASQLTLFTADVRTYPNSARLNDFAGSLHYFAGTQLMGHGDMPPAASTAFAEAVTYLTRAVAIRGSFVDIDAPLGMAEYRLGQYETAVPHLEQALAFTDYRDEALEMMADSLEQLHQPGRAIDLFKQIDAEGILDPPAWFALGNDAASRGDDAASIQYFRKFLAATPDNVAAHFNIGRAQNRLGDYAASLASAERCVALAGTPRVQADCLLLEADDFVRTGRRDEAMAAFEKARAIDPTNPLIKR